MSIPPECQQLCFPAGSEPAGHVMASSQPVWENHDFRASHQKKITFQLCNLVIPVAGIWYTWELQKTKWTLPVFQAFVNPNSLPGSHIWNTLDQIAFAARQNIWSCKFTHTRTNTHTRTHTNTHTHTHTQTHTHKHKHTVKPFLLLWGNRQGGCRDTSSMNFVVIKVTWNAKTVPEWRRRLTLWCKTKWYSHIVPILITSAVAKTEVSQKGGL